MTEFKTITGNNLYSQEYKEKVMEDYRQFYSNLKNYKDDEYKELLWLPDPKNIYKFDRKSNTNPIQFINQVHSVEIEKDKAELEHFRNLHKYDKKINDNQLKYWEAYYHLRDLERKQIFDKSQKIKDEIIQNKNLLELYKDNEQNEATEQN